MTKLLSPTKGADWLACFPNWVKQPWIQLKSNTRPLNCLTKISMWLAIDSGIRQARCAWNYKPHFPQEDSSQARREWHWAPGQGSVHGFPNRHPLCSAPFTCYFPTYEPMGLVCREWSRIRNGLRKINDRFMSLGTHTHTCVRLVLVLKVCQYFCVCPYAHEYELRS